MKMAKWLLVSHYFVVSALAASEAQLKFVPVPVEKRLLVKDSPESVRSSPSASSHHASVVPISNSTIRVSTHDISGVPLVNRDLTRAVHSDVSHDPGRLHTSASYHHQQPHRGDRSHSRYGSGYQSGYNSFDEHSRSFRGLQTPRVDVDLHGSHYPGPSYRFSPSAVFRHHQGHGQNYRENRVEVRIDDFRRDQTQRVQSSQNRPQEIHSRHHSQRPFDTDSSLLSSDVRGNEWQHGKDLRPHDRDRRLQDRDFRQLDGVFPSQDRGLRTQDRDLRSHDRDLRSQDRDLRSHDGVFSTQQDRGLRGQDRDLRSHDRGLRSQDRDLRSQDRDIRVQDRNLLPLSGFGDRKDDFRQSFRPDEGQSQSCGPQSPCLEPNGLFPVDGNCCGFVNCANCRPYTQRCAAGTVFDLDLWICNHERDTRQCAGNNRECAFATVNLRGQSQDYDSQDEGNSHRSFDASSGASSSNSHGWEYASASEIKEVKKKTGKVLASTRTKKPAKSSKA